VRLALSGVGTIPAVLRFPGVNSSIQQALDRLHPTLEALQDQMTSIWLPIQVGLVLIGALDNRA
jgi:hypothetical protein